MLIIWKYDQLCNFITHIDTPRIVVNTYRLWLKITSAVSIPKPRTGYTMSSLNCNCNYKLATRCTIRGCIVATWVVRCNQTWIRLILPLTAAHLLEKHKGDGNVMQMQCRVCIALLEKMEMKTERLSPLTVTTSLTTRCVVFTLQYIFPHHSTSTRAYVSVVWARLTKLISLRRAYRTSSGRYVSPQTPKHAKQTLHTTYSIISQLNVV